ncbi:MAG: asparagine synthase (glutamine-hydrolyzing) [Vicinamibacterales bacterium]
MCGIYGQYNYGTMRPVVREEVQAATRTLTHRGPDDEGYFLDGPVALGFRRLSIIDLSGGHQPMADADCTVWVAFNGEIYNFAELRHVLEGKGHRFRTRSDTEVIVHGYREWGDGVLERLHGMFGLAIWDTRRRRLVLARDAMGIKPVYYRVENGTIFFASEIRALAHSAPAPLEVDSVALNLFLRYRYTPSPLTLFKDVRKLAAGSMLVADETGIRHERWYRFIPTPFERPRPIAEAKRELHELYERALDRHLISDVPVGLLLSGGIDSALLLALMAKRKAEWPTYSVGYGASYADDELEDARRTAGHFGSRHVSIEITQSEFEQYLPRAVSSLEEPVAASSIVPMYVVCQRARQDVKAALIGQGPDELFGGYTRHLGVHYGRLWRACPRSLRQAVARGIGRLPRNEALKRGLHALDVPDRVRRYQSVFSILPGVSIDGLFRSGTIGPGAGDTILDCWGDLEARVGGTDELGGFQWIELQSSLPDELLMYGDKMSMAHGLEVRVPYLDRTIVEFAERLDASLKVRWGERKVLHRSLCSDLLPRETIRRKKRGFAGNVVDKWFQHSLAAAMDDMLLDRGSMMYRHLEPKAVGSLLRIHRQGAADHHKILFSLVVLEQWLRSLPAGSPVSTSVH